MTELTRPKPSRVKYAAMLVGALAVAATPLAYPATAPAEPNTASWDLEAYDDCLKKIDMTPPLLPSRDEYLYNEMRKCCNNSGGVVGVEGKCQTPPGDSQGSRQLPGNVHIPSDIGLEPVTKAPPRPIRVPTDIATASTVSQAPA
jgi:hypothetical protein